MKKKIIKALLVLFLLFLIGGGVALFSLMRMSNDLKSLISLHKVEIIRQDLVINVQNVQGNLFTVGTGLGRELDEIVQNVTSLDLAVNRCRGCHHREQISQRIQEVQNLIEQYKEALSAYITTTANERRLSRVKRVAADIGDRILTRTQDMTFAANQILQEKTQDAVLKIVKIQNLLFATLILTLLMGIVVAVTLTKTVTRPINRLVEAAKEISRGHLGFTTDFTDDTEFTDLAGTFNEMSLSLKSSHDKIVSYMNRLSVLVRSTVSLFSASDMNRLLEETAESVRGIVHAEQTGIVMFNAANQMFCLLVPEPEPGELCIGDADMRALYERSGKRAIILNDPSPEEVPFRELNGDVHPRNVMVVWLRHMGEFRGAIRVMNKLHADFDTEDLRLLSILANNFTTALDNITLYNDLTRKMQELRETQQQLVQAAKLAAIGELASNVAHEINNPLTSILGYAELIREESDRDVIMKDVEIIEQESLRAREIVRQLLEFSKKKPLELKDTDINELLRDVLKLTVLQLKTTEIDIVEKFSDLPPILSDSDQLKQVFLNIINNAVAAMDRRGTLTIETGRKGEDLFVDISDTGVGIDEQELPRIFEPFFTTKKEKGTGLGLSISYKIISAHSGRIDIASRKGHGSTFTVLLPLKKSVSHVSL